MLIDGSLSDVEVMNLGLPGRRGEGQPAGTGAGRFGLWPDFLEAMRAKDMDGSIGLFTSGTTGRPKMVAHGFSTLSRAVRVGAGHREDVWALAYSPTHIAGLQVLFQALLNENPLVCVFGADQRAFEALYLRYGINRISATPTYYRNFLIVCPGPFPGIKSATSGGERSSEALRSALKRAFPNAMLRNAYASTEAGSLLVSGDDCFRIPDGYRESMMISEDGELLIHESLLGTSETFILQDGWFHTGDLVERIDDRAFCFKSRMYESINVGGYKVDPEEIEAIIAALPDIKDVRVFGIKNSVTGEIVAADIVPARRPCDERALRAVIRAELRQVVRPYKMPAIINIVETIKATRTGKKARR